MAADWLTLTEASEMLGIHPITLRSWVDAGVVQAFRTPGGHRRFQRANVQAFLEQQRTAPETKALAATPAQTLERVRTEMGSSTMRQASWYVQLSEEQRAKHRALGQRLLGLLLQFVSRHENADEFLGEARGLAQEYGIVLAEARLGSSELARAFLFFRQTVIQATYRTDGTRTQTDSDGVRLLQRINAFMDELLIATLEAYDGVMQARTNAIEARAVPAPRETGKARRATRHKAA